MVQAALNDSNTKALVLATIGLGFADELTSAYDKGLPVVEFDSGLYSGGADITEGKDPTIGSVATNNKAAAAVVAENFYAYLKAQNLLADGYKIGIIQHDSTSTGIDRAAGFKEKIEELEYAPLPLRKSKYDDPDSPYFATSNWRTMVAAGVM